jgi:aminoglycoside 6-adenylyltransferase
MRSDEEILDLILEIARNDERIRAVIMNGSRVNPNVHQDIFQDFDIVYVVKDVGAFKDDVAWTKIFGEIMILQMPESMGDPPPLNGGRFSYLMQFADGNRIDLTLVPIAKLHEFRKDSLSVLLLDKDGIVSPFEPASESDYLPKPPTAKAFFDCCNEFWWVCPYVAKGLWREEIVYAKYMLDQVVRVQLMKMLVWHVGVTTGFSRNVGNHGKHLKQYLGPDLWSMLERTYSDAGYDSTWNALFVMCDLFRLVANQVASHFGFEYPQQDVENVSAHLRHVRSLPKDAKQIY